MNTYLKICTLLILLATIHSCSEDFQLTEPYKDIPVIYALFSRTDSAQYFRIQKAYVDENIPASQIALRPDSLYYENPTVKLINITQKKEYELVKVDGNFEGYQRNSGPFAKSPNYLYKILTKNIQVNGGDSLLLHVKPGEGLEEVTSRIVAVSDLKFTIPDDNTRQLKFFSVSSYDFQWKHKSNARIFDLKALVYVDEFNIVTQNKTSVIIEVPLASGLPGKEGNGDIFTSAKAYGSSFYNFLHDKLVPDPAVERNLTKIDFILTGGGPEIKEYQELLNANTGITASQEIPRYDNLSRGFGIFSSRHTLIKSITPQSPTVDSLQAHPLTKDLNFK